MRGTLRPIAFAISSVLRGTAQSPVGRAVPSHPTPRAEQKRPSPKQMRRISLEAFKPVAIPKKSRVEELGRAMEKVETHNNDPKTLGDEVQQSRLSQIFEMADGVWFDSRVKRICKIPDLQPRQASATQAFTIGNDRKDGSVLQAGDDDREIYPRLRFQLTGT